MTSIEYAQVLRLLGDNRVALQCFDGVSRTGLIRGTMRRRVWINMVSESIHPSSGLHRHAHDLPWL
jgi:initiation factor 1A